MTSREGNDCRSVIADLDHLFSEGTTVAEVNLSSGDDLQVVQAASGSFHVQFEIEKNEANRLKFLDVDSPTAGGVGVVFARVIGAGEIGAVEERNGSVRTFLLHRCF